MDKELNRMASEKIKSGFAQKSYYIHSLIGIALMFGFGFLPPFEPLTPIGMKYIGILLGLIYLWSLVEMLWPSILGLAAVVFTQQISGTEITAKAFGSDTIILVILALAVIYALTNTGCFDYIINWFLQRKIFQGHPWILSGTLLVIMYFVAALNGGFAMLFLMWEMVYKIADQVKMPRKSMWCAAMATGMILTYVYGSCLLPFMPTYLFIMGTFQQMTGMVIQPPMIVAIIMSLSIGLSTLLLYLALMRFVLRIDVAALKEADMQEILLDLPPINKQQKFSLYYLAIFIITLILPGTISTLGKGTAIAAFFGNLGTIGMCFIMFSLLCIIRIENKPILVFREVAEKIQWESVALMAVAFSFSSMITAEGTGVSEWIMEIVNPLLGGLNTYAFTVVIFLVTLLLTNVANNTVIMLLMITLINVYAPNLSLHLPSMAFLMLYLSQTAFMLPASSIYGALLHSQTSIVEKKYLYLCAVMTMVAAFVMMVVVAIPLGSILL